MTWGLDPASVVGVLGAAAIVGAVVGFESGRRIVHHGLRALLHAQRRVIRRQRVELDQVWAAYAAASRRMGAGRGHRRTT